MNSYHYNRDRQLRESIINQIGIGNVIKEVEVDRGHRNGPEIHKITDTGLILIYNKESKKLITKLIARVGQINRYYQNERPPRKVIQLARYHCEMGWNEV